MKEIVRFFYNKQGIGDVLLVRFLPSEVVSHQRINNLCVLYDGSQKVIGYQVFEASSIFTSLVDGGYFFHQATLQSLNVLLEQAGFDVIEADDAPKFIVGLVRECESHPNSNHLHMCKVDLGDHVVSLVCGATNVVPGLRVVCAVPNAVLPSGNVILDSEVMGVASSGMLCSYQELQIPVDQAGIIELDEGYEIGQPFYWKG